MRVSSYLFFSVVVKLEMTLILVKLLFFFPVQSYGLFRLINSECHLETFQTVRMKTQRYTFSFLSQSDLLLQSYVHFDICITTK